MRHACKLSFVREYFTYPACPDMLNHIIKRVPDYCGTSTPARATRLRSGAFFTVYLSACVLQVRGG